MEESGVATRTQIDAALSHIRTGTDLEAMVSESTWCRGAGGGPSAEAGVFPAIGRALPPSTILASTTSTLLPSALAAGTQHPERVIVTHYFFPPYLLPLVEVVRGPQTSDTTVRTVKDFYERIGKHPAIVEKEIAGFVAVRLQLGAPARGIFAGRPRCGGTGLTSTRSFTTGLAVGCLSPACLRLVIWPASSSTSSRWKRCSRSWNRRQRYRGRYERRSQLAISA